MSVASEFDPGYDCAADALVLLADQLPVSEARHAVPAPPHSALVGAADDLSCVDSLLLFAASFSPDTLVRLPRHQPVDLDSVVCLTQCPPPRADCSSTDWLSVVTGLVRGLFVVDWDCFAPLPQPPAEAISSGVVSLRELSFQLPLSDRIDQPLATCSFLERPSAPLSPQQLSDLSAVVSSLAGVSLASFVASPLPACKSQPLSIPDCPLVLAHSLALDASVLPPVPVPPAVAAAVAHPPAPPLASLPAAAAQFSRFSDPPLSLSATGHALLNLPAPPAPPRSSRLSRLDRELRRLKLWKPIAFAIPAPSSSSSKRGQASRRPCASGVSYEQPTATRSGVGRVAIRSRRRKPS